MVTLETVRYMVDQLSDEELCFFSAYLDLLELLEPAVSQGTLSESYAEKLLDVVLLAMTKNDHERMLWLKRRFGQFFILTYFKGKKQ